MWWRRRSEDNFLKLGLYFCHVDLGDQTQVIRLGGKYLYLLSYLASPIDCLFGGKYRFSSKVATGHKNVA